VASAVAHQGPVSEATLDFQGRNRTQVVMRQVRIKKETNARVLRSGIGFAERGRRTKTWVPSCFLHSGYKCDRPRRQNVVLFLDCTVNNL